MEETREVSKWVYIGTRVYKGKQTYWWMRESESLKPDGSCIIFAKQVRSAYVGQIYAFDVTTVDKGTGTSYIFHNAKGAEYVGMFSDEQKLMEWTVKHRACQASLSNARMSKKYEDLLHEALEPVRDAYHLLTPEQQYGFLAAVMEYITRRPRK